MNLKFVSLVQIIATLLMFRADSYAITPDRLQAKRAAATIAALTGQEELVVPILASIPIEILCDPGQCQTISSYRTLAPTRPPANRSQLNVQSLLIRFKGPVSASTVRLYQRAIDAQWRVTASEYAVWETLSRRSTAKKRNDQRAYRAQDQNLKQLKKAAAISKNAANVAWKAFATHTERMRIEIKASANIEAFAQTLRSEGFSPTVAEGLRAFGLSQADIEGSRAKMLEGVAPDKLPKTLRAEIANLIALNSDNTDIQQCSCRE